MTDAELQALLDTLLTAREVGTLTGITPTNLHYHDAELRPLWLGTGRLRFRYYRKEIAERYAEVRRVDNKYTLTLRDVGRILGKRDSDVKKLDHLLQPVIRDRGGNTARFYDPKLVLQYVAGALEDTATQVPPSNRGQERPHLRVHHSRSFQQAADRVKNEIVEAIDEKERDSP